MPSESLFTNKMVLDGCYLISPLLSNLLIVKVISGHNQYGLLYLKKKIFFCSFLCSCPSFSVLFHCLENLITIHSYAHHQSLSLQI